jgi:hypothetical protein
MILPSDETELSTKGQPDEENSLSTKEADMGSISGPAVSMIANNNEEDETMVMPNESKANEDMSEMDYSIQSWWGWRVRDAWLDDEHLKDPDYTNHIDKHNNILKDIDGYNRSEWVSWYKLSDDEKEAIMTYKLTHSFESKSNEEGNPNHDSSNGQFTSGSGGSSDDDSDKPKKVNIAQKEYDDNMKVYNDEMNEFNLKKNIDKYIKDYDKGIINIIRSNRIDTDRYGDQKLVAWFNDNRSKGERKITSDKVNSIIKKMKKLDIIKIDTYKKSNPWGYSTEEEYVLSDGYDIMKKNITEPVKPVKRRVDTSQSSIKSILSSVKKNDEEGAFNKLEQINSKRDFIKDGHYIIEDEWGSRPATVKLLHPSKRDMKYPEAPKEDGNYYEWQPNDFKVDGKMVKVGDTISFDDHDGRTEVIVSDFSYDGDAWEGPSVNGYVSWSSNPSKFPRGKQKGHGGHRIDDVRSIVSSSDVKMKDGNEVLEHILLNETYIQDQFGVFYRPVYVGENYKEHESDLVFEGKLYTTEGVGNCPFCKGAGKVTVEKLGLKDCPDCDGSGDIQGEQKMPPQELPVEEEKKPNPFAKESNVSYSKCPNCKFETAWKEGDDLQKQDAEREMSEHKKSKHGLTESCGCKTKGLEASISKYEKFIRTEINILKKRANEGESVGLMYGLPTVRKDGKKIKGTLAYAGVSLNDRIYLPEELAKGHGKTLPLLLNHSSTSGAEEELYRLDSEMRDHLENEKDYKVGEVTLTWNAEKLTLFYEGVIDNEFFQKEVDEMDMAVSLGIFYDSNSPKVCDENCYTLIKGAEFREVSLVYHAGFPIATIEAVEAKLKRASLKDIKAKASEGMKDKNGNMICHFCGSIDTVLNILEREIWEGWEKYELWCCKDCGNCFKGDIVSTDKRSYEESKANEDSLIKVEDKNDDDTKVTVLDEWKSKGEAIAEEEEDELPLGGSIDAEPKETDIVEQPMMKEVRSSSDFSVRGVSGMTISNSNGVEKYTFDPTSSYSTNMIHFSVTEQGGVIYGEEIQMQPKMATPEALTKEIESHPDVIFTDSDEDILKKN